MPHEREGRRKAGRADESDVKEILIVRNFVPRLVQSCTHVERVP